MSKPQPQQQPTDPQNEYRWTGKRMLMATSLLQVGLALPGALFMKRAGQEGVGVREMRLYVSKWIAPPPLRVRMPPTSRPVQREPEWETAVLERMLDFNTMDLRRGKGQIQSGGPPKDGIKSLTDPKVQPVGKAADFDADERVVVVTVGERTRAYPIGILNYHEAINDELGDVPVGVFYCPLCDSASVVDRRMDGRTLEFGISGLLANSNVLLHDRQDHALWSQVEMEAISGPYAGRSLTHLHNWQITTFARLKTEHPDATIVSKDTGHDNDYGMNPYGDYTRSQQLMFNQLDHRDDRFLNKARVIGIKYNDIVRAYPIAEMIRATESGDGDGRFEDSLGDATFKATVDPMNRAVRIDALPPGARVIHTFWFAWVAFHPDTQVYLSDGASP